MFLPAAQPVRTIALMHKAWLGLLCLQFIPPAIGYTTSRTTCTISPFGPASLVSAPDTRGTLSILWSCLFTVFACTWAILHLNIPGQRGKKDAGLLGHIKWTLKGFWTNFKWMIVTILAPELILGKAMCDLATAREASKILEEIAKEDKVPWSLAHSYYVCMGGFVLRGPKSTRPTTTDSKTSSEVEQGPSDKVATTGVEVEPELIQPTETTRPAELREYEIILHLSWRALLDLRTKEQILKRLPYITENEIGDKCQSNMFTKVIATAQVLWITIEVIARYARGLSISQLELAATAFAASAIITYLVNMKKPQGIQTPTTVLCYADAPPLPGPLERIRTSQFDYSILGSFFGIDYSTSKSNIYIRNDHIDSNQFAWFNCGVAIGGLVIGGIHITAWDFFFPTDVDQFLWRTASVYSTAVIPIGSIIMWAERTLNSNSVLNRLNIALSILYVIARLILLVEIFRTLFYLPLDTYITTWASDIPSVG